jgi:hypothetical protein
MRGAVNLKMALTAEPQTLIFRQPDDGPAHQRRATRGSPDVDVPRDHRIVS